MIRTVIATEYLTPLREGGSLPAIIRADDGQLYAMKFSGSGLGTKALIAELIVGEIARALGFRVPEIVYVILDPAIGRNERDPEIQDLLHASVGLNLGFAFLPQASAFNLLLKPKPTVEFASKLVWLDAFVTNVDRTAKNVNMLMYQGEIWLIDHGACLYFHHNWQDTIKHSENAFPMIRQHVLLALAEKLLEVEPDMKNRLHRSLFEQITSWLPDAWLTGSVFPDANANRAGYVTFLDHRLQSSRLFVEEAQRARALFV